MSPHVEAALTLPDPKPRTNNPLSRMIAEAVDHQLLCYANAHESFTTYEARDQLLKLRELESVDHNVLRLRVRDRLKTLMKHDLVAKVGVRGKNRGIYRMQLESPVTHQQVPTTVTTEKDTHSTSDTGSASLVDHLEQERHCLQMTMQVAISEAEHYKHLLSEFPDARLHISPLLKSAIERSGRLQGQWDANLKVREALSKQVPPAVMTCEGVES